jgi:hypothetical protein
LSVGVLVLEVFLVEGSNAISPRLWVLRLDHLIWRERAESNRQAVLVLDGNTKSTLTNTSTPTLLLILLWLLNRRGEAVVCIVVGILDRRRHTLVTRTRIDGDLGERRVLLGGLGAVQHAEAEGAVRG